MTDKNLKVLDYLFEIYRNDFKYRNLLRKRRFFFPFKRKKFLYKISGTENELKRKRRSIKINNYINKLKLKKFYGNINQKQFKKMLKKKSLSSNVLSKSFFYCLESRLDVILYRSNFVDSIFVARQIINHKKVLINGRVVNKPGYRLSLNDMIIVTDPILSYNKIKSKLRKNSIICNYPSYLEVNYKLASIILIQLPEKEEVPFSFFINKNSIIYDFLK